MPLTGEVTSSFLSAKEKLAASTPDAPIWEERWHPLREEWVIVAAHRNNRPWSGETVGRESTQIPEYVAECYLCPGNTRVSGQKNPDYKQTYVFDNDHPCVGPDAPVVNEPRHPFRNRQAKGLARVVCYSNKHNQTLAELEPEQIDELLAAWQEQYRELAARPEVNHVLIFENKGEVVGVSNPHPHSQIYATNFVFKYIETEANAARRHWNAHGSSLLGEIIAAEVADGRRILYESDYAVAFVPYFARYAYEVYVAPKKVYPSIAGLTGPERIELARALKAVLVRFDNLWRMPFPYVMALHNAPTDGAEYPGFHFHIEFHPPLRKPGLLKYLAGPEIGGGSFISDTSPEEKAAELRALPDIHYSQAARMEQSKYDSVAP